MILISKVNCPCFYLEKEKSENVSGKNSKQPSDIPFDDLLKIEIEKLRKENGN